MPRTARSAAAGLVYHVLNRGNGRQPIFHKDGDYAAFLQLLAEARHRAGPAADGGEARRKACSIELFAYCLMPNHWHLVVRPRTATALARFVGWLSNTHVRRHHQHYHSVGGGHVYQGRFKSFPVQDDGHLLAVLRYVESNAWRAKLCERAQDWPWGSAAEAAAVEQAPLAKPLPAREELIDAWPIDRPADWLRRLNTPPRQHELVALRTSVQRGRPYGDEAWVLRTAKRLALTHTLRPRGRPRKRQADAEKKGTSTFNAPSSLK